MILLISLIVLLSPFANSSEVIGRYTAGCIKNAEPLPKNLTGFQTARRSRKRFYVHPSMRDYLSRVGVKIKSSGTVLLIADTSRKNGGPDRPWHNSHQIGLDIDILLQLHPAAQKRSLSYSEREAVRFITLLTSNKKYVDRKKWGPHILPAVRAAATTTGVQRIFLNPVIKKKLCDLSGNASWLSKVRPWHNHDAHMHVRLYCPKDSPSCIAQSDPPSGHGCGKELDSWLDDIRGQYVAGEGDIHGRARALPKRCKKILGKP